MTTAGLRFALIALVLLGGAAGAQTGGAADNAQNGKKLFLAVGCYECHGTTGAGANTGPRLAPGPMPTLAFVYQLRHPLGEPRYGNMQMPAYSVKVLSDAQVADIYAYLLSIRPGPAAARIPLLTH